MQTTRDDFGAIYSVVDTSMCILFCSSSSHVHPITQCLYNYIHYMHIYKCNYYDHIICIMIYMHVYNNEDSWLMCPIAT